MAMSCWDCDAPAMFGDHCRGCFTRLPLAQQRETLRRLVEQAEKRRHPRRFELLLRAYEAVARVCPEPVKEEVTA